ncbi:hypothetical protein GUITHDRAFT_113938 [Guillardia theta CCMP2712]|uniref:Uncharacterized protein n=1 Tax=Guillardia theta (strain CCMP2712) TaxID=905079 RepID=L1IUL0_GUITC|nr:hypothetical protein GUITHDRAFT_113938 [Guillardia theta CCMP2712]EKX39946.1 hypothetical protein GUITHDRAFT_113938 [Guillardia theta CCMP2712]|eukprot:XP_005826926.1 hypothetical protein GUITHDRAFT_113938 [Guillardia theta CCMP2712]
MSVTIAFVASDPRTKKTIWEGYANGSPGKQQEFKLQYARPSCLHTFNPASARRQGVPDLAADTKILARSSEGHTITIKSIAASGAAEEKVWVKAGNLGDPLVVQILFKKQGSGLWKMKKVVVTTPSLQTLAPKTLPVMSERVTCADEEAGNEMLACARYGECEDMCIFIDNGSVPVDYQNEQGNTALHYSCPGKNGRPQGSSLPQILMVTLFARSFLSYDYLSLGFAALFLAAVPVMSTRAGGLRLPSIRGRVYEINLKKVFCLVNALWSLITIIFDVAKLAGMNIITSSESSADEKLFWILCSITLDALAGTSGRSARALPNSSGNTALHWAIQNKQKESVKMLIEKCSSVDVLYKNSFGKSALSEAFGTEDEELVQLLLGHSSASALENTQASGVQEEETDDEGGEQEEGGGGGGGGDVEMEEA